MHDFSHIVSAPDGRFDAITRPYAPDAAGACSGDLLVPNIVKQRG